MVDKRARVFAELVDRRALDRAYRYATLMLGNRTDAEDATHDAALTSWRKFGELRDPARFEAWFGRILVNECRDRLRSRRRLPIHVEVEPPALIKVHAAVYEGTQVRVATSDIGADNWRLSGATVQIGARPVPSTQIVLQGDSGWLLEVDRTVVGGPQLGAGNWQSWTPPCTSVQGPALLAASSPTELVAACDVGRWSNPKGERLYGDRLIQRVPPASASRPRSELARAVVRQSSDGSTHPIDPPPPPLDEVRR